MNISTKSAVYFSCRMILRPIASIFLKCGLTWKEFSDISKSVFVEAATDEFGIKGRPTNISRVSILTGISRKEVKRQRDLLKNDEPGAKNKTTDATRVLSGWFQDPEFLDDNGAPLLIKESGQSPNFEDLCARYSGDIAPQTMLKELLQTKTVERVGIKRLKVIRRYYQPARHDDENLTWAVSLIRDLADTMNNNVFLANHAVPRFGRKAENVRMPVAAAGRFQEYLNDRGQAFLEDVDAWLTENESKVSDGESEHMRLGLGMFAINDEFTKE